MSANIPSTMFLSELLKPTGYDCPANLQGKTFSESTSGGGGGADLEDNHETTIDVSAYTSPVAVTPIEGKDGMKKNTITLTNIPQAGTTLHAWGFDDAESGNLFLIYTTSATPKVGDDVYMGVEVINTVGKIEKNPTGVHEVSGDTITVDGNTHTRYSAGDVILQAGESGGVNVEPLSVTKNGTYTAPSGKAYSPVTVNVPTGGSATAYAWREKTTNEIVYTNFSTAPQGVTVRDLNYKILYHDDNSELVYKSLVAWGGIGQGHGYFSSDNVWGIEDSDSFVTESEYERYTAGDIPSFW